jgi:hypothetical protein
MLRKYNQVAVLCGGHFYPSMASIKVKCEMVQLIKAVANIDEAGYFIGKIKVIQELET